MKYNVFHTLLGLSLLFGSCKEFVEPTPIGSELPVFSIQATIGNDKVDWKVNGEDFKVHSTFDEDLLGVTTYQGTIQSEGCSADDCGPRLELQFRGTENIDEHVRIGSFPYRYMKAEADSSSQYNIRLLPEGLGDIVSCTWTVDGETMTTNGSEPLEFVKTDADPSVVPVTLVASFANGCQSEISNNVYLPHHGCNAKIEVSQVSDPYELLYQAVSNNSLGSEYAWTFTSGPTASSDEILYRYNAIPPTGIDLAFLSISNNGCVASHTRSQIVSDSLVECNINFDSEIETKIIYGDPPSLSKDIETVELFYIDESGTQYQSLPSAQPSWSNFEIIDVEDYVDPIVSSHKRSKKVTVKFSARLLTSDQKSLDIKEGTMVIPIGLGL